MPCGGEDAGLLWSQVPLLHVAGLFVYGVITQTLWYAPVWAWLLLVSAWAKRMTFLWGVGPPLALCVFERLAFNTGYVWKLLSYRLMGNEAGRLRQPAQGPAGHSAADARRGAVPVDAVAVGRARRGRAMLGGAVWLRRRREPI